MDDILFDIPRLRDHLREHRSCNWTDEHGHKLFFVLLEIPSHGMLIAYEGQGAKFIEIDDRPLNAFRLLEAGFATSLSKTLADAINALLGLDKSVAVTRTKPQTLQIPHQPRKPRK